MTAGSLSHTPAQVIAQLLVDLACGSSASLTVGWPVFSTNEPDLPDNVITVYDTEGNQDGRFMITGEVRQHYGLQFRIRGTSHSIAHAKANTLKQILDQTVLRTAVALGGSTYLVQSVSRRSGPISIGKESPTSRRVIFTLNAVVSLRQVS